ncbi:alginate export family protein [Niastella sp. OAS944]|uniref:alginate export family protein n=1 Tax=Niastella sp. OAS944 TaxID=2664089 RepID=UPI00348F2F95|nr:hypothetical protein [Chitinophagaceae bacterium OAS944]
MKHLLFSMCLFFFLHANSQQLPQFKTLRYDEDYSVLKSDTTASFYRNIKYLSLSAQGNTYLSIGGEVRYQYFNIRNEDWGDAPKDDDGFLFSRFLLHTDLHAGKNFRLFGQLQGSMANGKASGTSAVDENPLDLHQAFFDINTNSKNAILRVGRQELSYGSQRLISVRELPNNRQSFDAVRSIFSLGSLRLDAFYGRYVTAKKEIFDDVSNRDINIWGAYLVKNKVPILKNVDLYYLGLSKTKAAFEDSTGKERRHSVGARVWGADAGWKYDLEGVYQFGKFVGKAISAWTLSANTSYKFTRASLQPEIGIKTEVISGDRQRGDGRLQTFNPLFPRGAYFGLAALIGPSNLFDIHPSIAFELIDDKLTWTVDHDVFWRYSTQDGIYAPNVSIIHTSGNSKNKFIGHQLATDVTFTPNQYFLLRVEATWFKAGAYLKDVSPGKDILFGGATLQVKF